MGCCGIGLEESQEHGTGRGGGLRGGSIAVPPSTAGLCSLTLDLSLFNKLALRAAGVPSTFTKWRDLAAYRDQWRVL